MEYPAENSPAPQPDNPPRPDPVEVGSDVRLTVAHLRERLTQAFNREVLVSGSTEHTNRARLALTPAAIKALRALSSAPGVPDGAGLRITKVEASAHDDALQADMVRSPGANDRVIVEAGVRVFVQPDAEPYLSGKMLNAQFDESGQAQFMLRD